MGIIGNWLCRAGESMSASSNRNPDSTRFNTGRSEKSGHRRGEGPWDGDPPEREKADMSDHYRP
ncbi:MAG: hypothetical protein CMI53_03790 [Parcubacteria group bacterium]|nr:hypothetical protein [Parcubacteria group bacterium]